MNYLGHIYLSGDDEKLMIGNFIGDYVKGRNYLQFPNDIQQGILLHRQIDSFTDTNIHWQSIRELIRPVYKRYSGVIADLFVDHFLAVHWHLFSPHTLSQHSKWAYAEMLKNFDILPQQVQQFIPYLIQHRRLQSYATIEGLQNSMAIMSLHTSLPNHTSRGIELLLSEYHVFEEESIHFILDVKKEFM